MNNDQKTAAAARCPACGKKGLGAPKATKPVAGLPTPTYRRCRYCDGVFDTDDLINARKVSGG